MKLFWSLLVIFICVPQSFGTTLKKEFSAFNSNWNKYCWLLPDINIKAFDKDKDYIQTHLFAVLEILKNTTTPSLTVNQCISRSELISLLETYRLAGNFPINYSHLQRTPVFIDENNTHCAVGYLLQHSGNEETALQIAEKYNYAWLKDIDNPEFVKWQKKSGFTMEELKLIQGAYDYYMPRALYQPNKYEIPQKPEVMKIAFEKTKGKIWVEGEGKGNVLHGKWTQNYSKDLPWIVGYFENGNRTGQWMEYYQGTNQICRTENWRNDKLNGVRKRFNRQGTLIEEILFKDGKAIRKTNYELNQMLRTERVPVDSNEVTTKIFTMGGTLLAYGTERIYNTSGLEWFQDIPLTALNSFSVTSREQAYDKNDNGSGIQLYNQPNLVEYHKEQDWVFYKQFNPTSFKDSAANLIQQLELDYKKLANNFTVPVSSFQDQTNRGSFDSLVITFQDDRLHHFKGFGAQNIFVHIEFAYHEKAPQLLFEFQHFNQYYHQSQVYRNPISLNPYPRQKMIGERDQLGRKIAIWNYYNRRNVLYKTEQFLIPYKEEAVVIAEK